MAGINLNKKLWRIPQQGMVRGVCAGIANYFDVPVKLVRILVVLSIFFGLALFTLVAYIILSFALDPMPDNMAFGEQLPSSSELLDEVEAIVYSGTKLNIDYFLDEIMDEDHMLDIYDYFKESTTDKIDDALDELGDEFTEEEVRLVRIKFISEMAN